MVTQAVWVGAFTSMTVAGIARHYDEPPASVSTADLPAAYPLFSGAGLERRDVSCVNANKTRRIDYVIIIEPVGQGTQALNYAQIPALIDNLEAALDALTVAVNFVDYSIESNAQIALGGVAYWGIVASAIGRDY